MDISDAKKAIGLAPKGYLIYSPDGKKTQLVTLQQLYNFFGGEKDASLIYEQDSLKEWRTDYDKLYFDTKYEFSYRSGGERQYFIKTEESPSLIAAAKWLDAMGEEHFAPIILSTTTNGILCVRDIRSFDHYYERIADPIYIHYKGRDWFGNFLPYNIDYDIDRFDDVKPIQVLSNTFIYGSIKEAAQAILATADPKPIKKYYGMAEDKGVAFFAGARSKEDIWSAPFIITVDGEVIKKEETACT